MTGCSAGTCRMTFADAAKRISQTLSVTYCNLRKLGAGSVASCSLHT